MLWITDFFISSLDLNISVDVKLIVSFNNAWLLRFVMTKTASQILNTNHEVLNIILDIALSDVLEDIKLLVLKNLQN